jgi:hypothetical protein
MVLGERLLSGDSDHAGEDIKLVTTVCSVQDSLAHDITCTQPSDQSNFLGLELQDLFLHFSCPNYQIFVFPCASIALSANTLI